VVKKAKARKKSTRKASVQVSTTSSGVVVITGANAVSVRMALRLMDKYGAELIDDAVRLYFNNKGFFSRGGRFKKAFRRKTKKTVVKK